MLKLNKIVFVTGMSIALASPLCFGWGLPPIPGMGSSSSGSSTSAADVDKFLADGKTSHKMISDSLEMLLQGISTIKEREAHQSSLNQLKAGLDAHDKKAEDQLAQIQKSDAAKVLAAANDKSAQENLKHLSSEQKKLVAGAFGNLALGVLFQVEQLKTGQNLLQSASGNMSLVSKLPDLKDAIADMADNVRV